MNLVAILITTAFAIMCISSPERSLFFAKEALSLCANSVAPSLFPFFVCSGLFVRLGAAHLLGRVFSKPFKSLFGVSGNASLALIIGLISGYPVGAKTVCDLTQQRLCSKSEGEKLLGFCNNSGPLFILGAVGAGMLGSYALGILLYSAHFAAAITAAICLRGVKCEILPPAKITPRPEPFSSAFTKSVISAADSVFTICGFVVVFYTFLNLVSTQLSLGTTQKAALFGIFEPSGGSFYTAAAFKKNPDFMCAALSAVIAWSGISVHLQVLGIIKAAGLSAKYYFSGKIISTVTAPVYALILRRFFISETAVFMPLNKEVPIDIYGYLCFIGLMCIIVVLLMQFMLIVADIFKKQRKKVSEKS